MKLLIKHSINEFTDSSWNSCAGSHPYVQHSFFRALEESGSVGPQRSLIPIYFALQDTTGQLIACAPAMLKWGNKREFGPEIEWLTAGIALDCFAWPKAQLGVPFCPMTGPRILVKEGMNKKFIQRSMLSAITRHLESKTHCTVFNLMNADADLIENTHTQNFLYSYEHNSIWRNKNYGTYTDYLQTLSWRQRYRLRKERSSEYFNDLTFLTLSGPQLPATFWQDFYQGYEQVCKSYGNNTWLPYEFYVRLGELQPESLIVFAAFRGEQYLASGLCLVDTNHLYIQNWSILDDTPDVCFELLCHMPIEYAIERKLTSIDSGPAGEHKIIRGFPAEAIANAHWFAHDDLRALAKQKLTNHQA